MKASELKAIDPALGLLGEFAKVGHGTVKHLQAMRQDAIFTDGALPARLKALAAALWSISARCEPCIRFYMLRARELGASDAEVSEMLAVASTMGGCVGETWALKAFQASRLEGQADETCC